MKECTKEKSTRAQSTGSICGAVRPVGRLPRQRVAIAPHLYRPSFDPPDSRLDELHCGLTSAPVCFTQPTSRIQMCDSLPAKAATNNRHLNAIESPFLISASVRRRHHRNRGRRFESGFFHHLLPACANLTVAYRDITRDS